MRFSRQEYWSGLPFPSPGDLPDPGIEPASPASQVDSLLTEPLGKTLWSTFQLVCMYVCVCAYTQETLMYMYMHMHVYIYIYTHTLISGLILMFLHPTFSIRFTYHFAEVHPLGLLSVKALGYKFSSLCKSDRGFILF